MRWIEIDRARGRGLHRENLPDDRLGGLGGLHRERLHFGGDHRKAAARLTRARGLDRGVERQEIGLPGDILNHFDDIADLLRGIGQRRHLARGRLRFVDCDADHIVGLLDLACDFTDRTR